MDPHHLMSVFFSFPPACLPSFGPDFSGFYFFSEYFLLTIDEDKFIYFAFDLKKKKNKNSAEAPER